jgi:hypothetical protein
MRRSAPRAPARRLIANLAFCRRFLRPPSTEAPSLHRSYPASSVLRASPPSQSAQPFSRKLPVDPHRDHRWDFPCCVWPLCLHAVANTPAGLMELVRSYCSTNFGLPTKPGRVGSCIDLFEACSALQGRGMAPYSVGPIYRALPVSSGSVSLTEPLAGFHSPPPQTVREVLPHTAYRLSVPLERSKPMPHIPGL